MTRSKLSLARIQAIADRLSDRDRMVLDTVSRVRIATADQLHRLHFTDVSPRERRRVLANLDEKKLLFRLPRPVGGVRAGSSGYAYALGSTGQRLRDSRTSTGRARRPSAPGTTFLKHTLAVTEVFVGLHAAEARGELRVRRFEAEPAAWRPFTGRGGTRLTLKPDAYLELGVNSHRDHWFLEVDLGTESTTTLHRKCQLYRDYRRTGNAEQAHGAFPLVLFAVTDERRKGVVVDVLARQPQESWPLFTVCLLSDTLAKLVKGAGS